jgi:hypothetical protein
MPLSRAALAIRESKTFETVGSKTGKRYRIKQGNQQNVFELDETGQPVRGLCFVPQGFLASGDVMLAQKIALETDEEAAMKVAVPFSAGTGLGMFVRLMARDARRTRFCLGFIMNCLVRVADLLGLVAPAARVSFPQGGQPNASTAPPRPHSAPGAPHESTSP